MFCFILHPHPYMLFYQHRTDTFADAEMKIENTVLNASRKPIYADTGYNLLFQPVTFLDMNSSAVFLSPSASTKPNSNASHAEEEFAGHERFTGKLLNHG